MQCGRQQVVSGCYRVLNLQNRAPKSLQPHGSIVDDSVKGTGVDVPETQSFRPRPGHETYTRVWVHKDLDHQVPDDVLPRLS